MTATCALMLRVRPIVALRRELDEAADRRVAAVVEARELAADLDPQGWSGFCPAAGAARRASRRRRPTVSRLELHEHHVAHA